MTSAPLAIVLGTRGSALALAQSNFVAGLLRARGHTVRIEIIKTSGDRDQSSPFAAVGTAGIFVRELEHALVERRVDLAVHSYKDLPSQSPAELVVAAVPEREDVADLLIARPEAVERGAAPGGIALRAGARVGSSSTRRACLLRELRPDLSIELLRGNVPTRVARVREGRFDAALLASAGVDRLLRSAAAGGERFELGELVRQRLDPRVFVPAASQGALALQVRVDGPVRAAVAELDRPELSALVAVEREFLALADGGCQSVCGAWCEREAGGLALYALLERDGRGLRTCVRAAQGAGLAARALARLREPSPEALS